MYGKGNITNSTLETLEDVDVLLQLGKIKRRTKVRLY